MSYVHIVTVGVSLASNFEKEKSGKRVPEEEIETKLAQMTTAEKTQYVKRLLKYAQDKYQTGEIAEASAELNALTRYLKEMSIAYLLHTDTNLGECCAKALKQYLENQGPKVAEPIQITGLHSPETFQKGLAHLVHETANILENHKNVRICATGGFKPEIAIASVLGFIAQAPVYYIHETFKRQIQLPALPIDWKHPIQKYQKALKALTTAGERGIEKTKFIQAFGQENRDAFLNNWLIEEQENRYTATEISLAILKAMQTLYKST